MWCIRCLFNDNSKILKLNINSDNIGVYTGLFFIFVSDAAKRRAQAMINLIMFFKKRKIEATEDEELLRLYQKTADSRHLGLLFERYAHLVLATCMKYLKSQEDSQDAAMKIYEEISVKLLKHEVSAFKFWLHAVAKNHCLMHLRKQKSETGKYEDFKKEAEAFMENDESEHLLEETTGLRLEKLDDALEMLKAEQKDCLKLFYLEQLSYVQVSEKTGLDLKQVKSHIQNGKRNLKTLLEGISVWLVLALWRY